MRSVVFQYSCHTGAIHQYMNTGNGLIHWKKQQPPLMMTICRMHLEIISTIADLHGEEVDGKRVGDPFLYTKGINMINICPTSICYHLVWRWYLRANLIPSFEDPMCLSFLAPSLTCCTLDWSLLCRSEASAGPRSTSRSPRSEANLERSDMTGDKRRVCSSKGGNSVWRHFCFYQVIRHDTMLRLQLISGHVLYSHPSRFCRCLSVPETIECDPSNTSSSP